MLTRCCCVGQEGQGNLARLAEARARRAEAAAKREEEAAAAAAA